MAKCGIKKYDELPSVVGWIDVDMHRWVLGRLLNPLHIYKFPLIRFFLLPSISKKRCIANLDKAYLNYQKKNKKMKGK